MKHVISFLYLTLMLICSLLIPTTANAGHDVYQAGKASWYGSFHHGRKTASGEVFNMNGLSAAHRTLPLGTMIEVTNKDTGKSIVVKVNDRGPYIGNRILDLSRGAAKRLGMIKDGVGNVEITVLSQSEPKSKQKKDVVNKRTTEIYNAAATQKDVDVELTALRQTLSKNKSDTLPLSRGVTFLDEGTLTKQIEDVELDPLQRLISDLNTNTYTGHTLVYNGILKLPKDMY